LEVVKEQGVELEDQEDVDISTLTSVCKSNFVQSKWHLNVYISKSRGWILLCNPHSIVIQIFHLKNTARDAQECCLWSWNQAWQWWCFMVILTQQRWWFVIFIELLWPWIIIISQLSLMTTRHTIMHNRYKSFSKWKT
jgi:hypothetical protein